MIAWIKFRLCNKILQSIERLHARLSDEMSYNELESAYDRERYLRERAEDELRNYKEA